MAKDGKGRILVDLTSRFRIIRDDVELALVIAGNTQE
jgi:hypothetical protein